MPRLRENFILSNQTRMVDAIITRNPALSLPGMSRKICFAAYFPVVVCLSMHTASLPQQMPCQPVEILRQFSIIPAWLLPNEWYIICINIWVHFELVHNIMDK